MCILVQSRPPPQLRRSYFFSRYIAASGNLEKKSILPMTIVWAFDLCRIINCLSPKLETVCHHAFVKVLLVYKALCSKNFQNVKWRLDFVEIWSFYCHSDFMWNQILVNSNGPKMLILTILEVLNFDFSNFEQFSSPKFTKNSKSESLKLPKMTFLDRLNSPKFDFT